jgi:diacylglycerol kinase (ATP)
MSEKRRYYFIINPISGGKTKQDTVKTIEEILKRKKVEHSFGWWNDGISVSSLVKDAKQNGYDTIVAVGGDGTINQVASEIVNTDLLLGIIPLGSGNGFARHLGIRGRVEDELLLLLKNKSKTIDTGTCNGQFFINIAGVGFDAHVSHKFSQSDKRGMLTYAKVSLLEARTYPEQNYKLILDGKRMEETAFLISIANGSQWGNEFYIAPDAELNDGQLRCCLLNKPPLMAIPGLIKRFLTGEIAASKYYKDIPFKHLKIIRQDKGAVHLDGEPVWMDEELNFEVNRNSLHVISNG